MALGPTLPPDLTSYLSRFSKEELHQIGLALIQQPQHSTQMQQQFHHPGSSLEPTRRAPRSSRPPLETLFSIPISVIPPLMNHQAHRSKVRPLMEQQCTPITSTPRRPASESFDYSDGNPRITKKRPRNNNFPLQNERVDQHHLHTLVPPQHQHFSFNLDTLKRAVSNYLPLFFISFDPSVELDDIPTSIQMAVMLKKFFSSNRIPVKELSMCVQARERRFKFGVHNKNDFLTLYNLEWPDSIENKKVEVTKPHSLPSCYALVVRYIPSDVTQEFARQEIMKTIPSAVGFSSINYHYRQRSSYDLRFSVGNLEHYRDKCQLPISCRKCLVPYINGVRHVCQGDKFKCAQCEGEHFSLSSSCPVIKQYKQDLKAAVDKALASGVITRPPPGAISRPFQQHKNEFPPLNQVQVNKNMVWSNSNDEVNSIKVINELATTTKGLSQTIIRIDKGLNELNSRFELQQKNILIHYNSITAAIDSILLLSKWVQGNSNEKSKLKKFINKSMDALQKLKEHLGSSNSNGAFSSNSSTHPNTTNNLINNKNNGEVELNEDLSMNSQF